MDDVPVLLKSEDVKDINKLLYVVFSSLPSNFEELIKWVAEVRRHEDGGASLSQEEKGRLAVKVLQGIILFFFCVLLIISRTLYAIRFETLLFLQEEVLKQVQETGLFKHVAEFLSSANSCCRSMPILSPEDDLPRIAAHICCQGAEILAGKFSSSGGYCCRETCVRCLKTTDEKSVTLVSGTVVDGGSEQGVDVLVPSAQMKPSCCGCGPSRRIGMHPAGNDVLTALLLALPPETWSGIKDGKLLQEMNTLVSTQRLPMLLQEEVIIFFFLGSFLFYLQR